MGKSIRSKWRRKMRNIKREKNAGKEIERLKRIANLAMSQDEEMKDLYNVKTANEVLKSPNNDDADGMDVDKQQKKYSAKTMKDEHGSYPNWMNQRAIKRQKKRAVKVKKNTKKKKAGKK